MDDAQMLATLADHDSSSDAFWMQIAELAGDRIQQAEARQHRTDLKEKLQTGEYFVKWGVLHTQDCRVAQNGIDISLGLMAEDRPRGGGGPWVQLVHRSELSSYDGQRCRLCAPTSEGV